MAVHYRTQGFFLRKTDLREADQVFIIYTKDFGKLKILGKAIRKIKSKLRSGAELFYLSEIEFIQGKAHRTLTDAITIEKFKNIRQDLEKLETAKRIAETADDLITDQEKDEEIWNLLNEIFEKLNNSFKCNPTGSLSLRSIQQVSGFKIYHYFLWNLLSILGYQIDLYHCIVCQNKLVPEKLYFSPEEGIVCSKCSGQIENKEDISPEVIKILRLFLKKDWNILPRLKIEDSQRKELKKIQDCFLDKFIL